MQSFEEVVQQQGFMTDRQIRAALDNGYLIDRGTWDPGLIRHASYMLRLGNKVEVATTAQATAEETKQFIVVRLTPDSKPLELYPGDTAMLYSLEHLRIPDSVLAFTVSRGILFAESLTPENTYVDPGFVGYLYTTVTNVSNRVIQMEYEMPIARLFFYKLSECVERPWRPGATLGIKQEIESIRLATVATVEQCRGAQDNVLLGEIQRISLGGIHLSEMFRRERRKRTMLLIGIVLWPIFLLVANTPWVHSNVGPLWGNVLAGLLVSGITVAIERGLNKLRSR